MTRKELQKEFSQQLYLSASFFKMKTTGSSAADKAANASVPLQPFPHPAVESKFVAERDKWHRVKNILRGEDVAKYNSTTHKESEGDQDGTQG